MAAVPLCPSDVAVIVVEPAATPVTRPLPFTVAAAMLELVHVTVRPVSVLPLASFTVAVSCTVWPADTEADGGVTVTDATGTVATVIAAVPLFPSLVAVSVAAPTATPVACPVPFTVATAGLLLDHVTVRPPSGLPKASRVIAKYCAVCPTPIVAVGGGTAPPPTPRGQPRPATLPPRGTMPAGLG